MQFEAMVLVRGLFPTTEASQETKFISTTEDTEDTEKRPKGKRLNFLCVLCVLCGSTKTANRNHRIESQHVSSRTPGPLTGLESAAHISACVRPGTCTQQGRNSRSSSLADNTPPMKRGLP